MLYQRVQHNNASFNDGQFRFISCSTLLSRKVLKAISNAMSPRKWLSGISQVTLIGALVMSGCSSKDPTENLDGQSKLPQQEKGSAATQTIHKQVGEASWYGPGFQGQETACVFQ